MNLLSMNTTRALRTSISRRVYSVQHCKLIHTTRIRMAAKTDWSAVQYLKFGDERTRPVRDLLAQIPLESPKRIVDLGCGPGNSTAVLVARYPRAHLTGTDSSPDMIATAKAALPDVEFVLEDVTKHEPQDSVDLYFSNAVFQWLPSADRIRVIQQLLKSQSPGGVFAFQVPDNLAEPSHTAMQETAMEGPWAASLKHLTGGRDQFQTPQELYNQIQPLCSSFNIWHTVYYHVLQDHQAVVEWVKGTGLRPFIDPLSDEERDGYLKAYLERLKKLYPTLKNGKVMLRYPRLFMVATRA